MSKQANTSFYQVPLWVECFGYVNLAFLLMPACLVSYVIWGQNLWMEGFGFKVYAREHLGLYVILVLLPFVGGLAAIGVLRRRRWGLALGTCFSIAALLLCGSSFFCAAALQSRSAVPVIEIILIGLFLRWTFATLKGPNKPMQPTPR